MVVWNRRAILCPGDNWWCLEIGVVMVVRCYWHQQERPGMLLNILQCTGQLPPPTTKKMSSPQTAEIEKFSPKMIFNLLFHTKISLTGGRTKAQLFSVNSYQLTTTSHTDGSHLNVCKIPCPSFSIPSRHPQPMTDGYRDTKTQTPIFQEEKTLWCHLCSRATVGSS